MQLKIIVEGKWKFSFDSVKFFLITKADVQKSIILNIGKWGGITCEYQRTRIDFVNTVECQYKYLQ